MSTSSVITVAKFSQRGGQASVSAPVGAVISIHMETSPLRFWWYLEGDLPDCLDETRHQYIESANHSGIVGLHGIFILEYRVLRPCAAPLRFRYKRVRKADTESYAMITVDISVRDARDST